MFHPDPDFPGTAYAIHGCFLDAIDLFDNRCFCISTLEAKDIDPQQRWILEVGYQAYIRSSYTKKTIVAMASGVFVACGGSSTACGTATSCGPYSGTGYAASILANRISYVLGLTGPSLVVDTACSSGLVATNLALDKLRSALCPNSLAASVNALMNPLTFVSFCKSRMLSTHGRCKTLDASANGYVRGEASGAVVLARVSDEHTTHARVLGCSVNQDGRSASLTAPNGPSQNDVILSACRDARLSANHVSIAECHGTGTALGDPIEVGALMSLRLKRELAQPLMLAALKSNIGHLEISSGTLGLIKCIILGLTGVLPPNLHLRLLNPHMQLEGFPSLFPTDALAIHSSTFVGVSSFGFGGTSAHAIEAAAEAPHRKHRDPHH